MGDPGGVLYGDFGAGQHFFSYVNLQAGAFESHEFFFEVAAGGRGGRPRVTETEDGRVDHFAVKDIGNTTRGQLVARRIPATKGVAGKSIRGEEISATDGGEGTVSVGRGVESALGNPNILCAAVDGQVKFVNNVLEVLALYEVEGDVDVSTGSIDFIGSSAVAASARLLGSPAPDPTSGRRRRWSDDTAPARSSSPGATWPASTARTIPSVNPERGST